MCDKSREVLQLLLFIVAYVCATVIIVWSENWIKIINSSLIILILLFRFMYQYYIKVLSAVLEWLQEGNLGHMEGILEGGKSIEKLVRLGITLVT